MELNALRQQIPCLAKVTYLNSGSVGPTPAVVLQAQERLLQEITAKGGAAPNIYGRMKELIMECRQTVAKAIGASVDEVALTSSTSDGIGAVASGTEWQAGDEVITSNLEHTSGLLPWQYIAERYGVKVVQLQGRQGILTADDFAQAITPRTRLICISHVSWNSGAILPVAEVSALAAKHGIKVVVDGAQAAGHIPINVQELGCDFYALPGQKWMMGPLGTGALYIRRDVMEKLAASRVGWASAAGEDMQGLLHNTARRYEAGTLNTPALVGWQAAIELVESLGGIASIFARIQHLATYARQVFQQIPGCQVLGPTKPELWTGLLPLQFAGRDPKEMAEWLWQEHQVITRWIPNPYALRLSLHAFTSEDEIDKVVALLK